MAEQPTREELQATLAARRELGPESDAQLAEAFLERIERGLDERIDRRLRTGRTPSQGGGGGYVLPLASLGLGIPLSGIAAGTSGLAGLIICWAGIVGVNIANRYR
jgi:hypothetical protein